MAEQPRHVSEKALLEIIKERDQYIAALQAEVLALRADRERLDAVEENALEIQVHYERRRT